MPMIDTKTHRSPNYNDRPQGVAISAIVVHSCEGRPLGNEETSSIPYLKNPAPQGNPLLAVSAHYYITRAGTIYQLVDDARRAWHAGVGQIDGVADPNDYSIGIELEHAEGAPPYTAAQRESLTWLCQTKMRMYAIPARRVVSHRAAAPGRKHDPTDWPEPSFRTWADELALYPDIPPAPHYPRAEHMHGLVLTGAAHMDRVLASIRAGAYRAIKVVTAWGLVGGWSDASRARAAAACEHLVVRTHAGDPSAKKPYLHPEEVLDEIRPWLSLRPGAWIELGNEPNAAMSLEPWAYRWYLLESIKLIRGTYPDARIIAPALVLDRGTPDMWIDVCADAFLLCDAIGVHVYAFRSLAADDTGQQKKAAALYSGLGGRPWVLTEYGINAADMAGADKGRAYAAFVRSLPLPYIGATYYHLDERADVGSNNARYHIDLDGDRAYGAAWRAT